MRATGISGEIEEYGRPLFVVMTTPSSAHRELKLGEMNVFVGRN